MFDSRETQEEGAGVRKAMKASVLNNEHHFRKTLCFWTWICSFNLPACILPPRLEELIQNRSNLRIPLSLGFPKCFTLYKRGIAMPNAVTVHSCHVSNWPLTFDGMECATHFRTYVMPSRLQRKIEKAIPIEFSSNILKFTAESKAIQIQTAGCKEPKLWGQRPAKWKGELI